MEAGRFCHLLIVLPFLVWNHTTFLLCLLFLFHFPLLFRSYSLSNSPVFELSLFPLLLSLGVSHQGRSPPLFDLRLPVSISAIQGNSGAVRGGCPPSHWAWAAPFHSMPSPPSRISGLGLGELSGRMLSLPAAWKTVCT